MLFSERIIPVYIAWLWLIFHFVLQVVHNLGLCIALWDIRNIEDAYIFPGDGASHSIVHFRYVVFRPFIDEILLGKIKSCSKEGVHGRWLRLIIFSLV